jgi:Ser/Thr protein kinase RdoA (MazF antagonist)
MLSVDGATALLVERGLIDPAWIIDGALTIKSAARRNRNLRVEGAKGAGFLIKQPDNPGDGDFHLLQREAAFHRFCLEETAARAISTIVPRLVWSDNPETLLVFELIAEATSLWARLEAGVEERLTVDASRALGRTLGTFHRLLCLNDWKDDTRLARLARGLPWVLRVHQPVPSMLASVSRANLGMMRILQTEEGLGKQLDRLAERWRPGSVIHGDVRLDNVLIRTQGAENEDGPVELWIVDWEAVGFGDPAWDVAGAFQDFLVYWVFSMPLSDELTAEQMIAQARVPLGGLRTALRALWSGYKAGACLDGSEADDMLLRAVAFSAARLIQSAYEISSGSDSLAGPPVVLLQIAANLLAEPERGQIELYGIPLGCPIP